MRHAVHKPRGAVTACRRRGRRTGQGWGAAQRGARVGTPRLQPCSGAARPRGRVTRPGAVLEGDKKAGTRLGKQGRAPWCMEEGTGQVGLSAAPRRAQQGPGGGFRPVRQTTVAEAGRRTHCKEPLASNPLYNERKRRLQSGPDTSSHPHFRPGFALPHAVAFLGFADALHAPGSVRFQRDGAQGPVRGSRVPVGRAEAPGRIRPDQRPPDPAAPQRRSVLHRQRCLHRRGDRRRARRHDHRAGHHREELHDPAQRLYP